MNNKPAELAQGTLNDIEFKLLLSLTKIRSEALIDALRDHYVEGVSKSEAYTRHDVDKTIFSRKLPVMRSIYDTIIKFMDA